MTALARKRILIVGGVARGASCAARLRRLDETAEIVVFDRGPHVSFANCGLPYFVGDVITDEQRLVVASPDLFRERFAIGVRTRHEVTAIDRARREIVVRDLAGGTETHERWQDYDSKGRLISFGTLAGVVGKLIYEEGASGRVSALADRDSNEAIRFAYDSQGNLSGLSDGTGRTVEYTYTNGLLTKVQDVLGQETTYEYDAKGRIVRSVDSGGRPTIVTYDSYGGVASVVDRFGKGHFFEYDYDEARKESYARVTTSSGKIEEIWYDRDGETKRVDVNGRTLFKLAKEGRNLIVTDEKGNITRKDYDEWDNLIRVVYADGSNVAFEYDLRFNKVKKVTSDIEVHVLRPLSREDNRRLEKLLEKAQELFRGEEV